MIRFLSKLFGSKPTKERHPVAESPGIAELSAMFPYTLHECGGDQAAERLERLRQEGKQKGYSPLLISDAEMVKAIADRLKLPNVSPADTLGKARSVDIASWFAERALE